MKLNAVKTTVGVENFQSIQKYDKMAHFQKFAEKIMTKNTVARFGKIIETKKKKLKL